MFDKDTHTNTYTNGNTHNRNLGNRDKKIIGVIINQLLHYAEKSD